jgi:hydrogenase maturation factor
MPAQVVARDGDRAVIRIDGRVRAASTFLLPDVAVGDWVYVAAGTIVDRMSSDEAAQIEHEIKTAREVI